MTELEIILKLEKDCCIQSAAKKEYNRMLRDFLTGGSIHGPEDEYMLELLRDFLESTNFPALRSSNEALSGVKNYTCILTRNPDGKPYLAMHNA